MQYITDWSIHPEGAGFQATLSCSGESVPDSAIACNDGLTLTAPGEFSKNGGYDNGHECRWILECDAGIAPSVTFTSFQTEAGWDFVRMYDGADDTGPSLAVCHGTSCDGATASGSAMLVRLTSDGSVTADGFSASYTCVPAGPLEPNPCGAAAFSCEYGTGNGVGGTETLVGSAPDRGTCANMVHASHPDANGARYSSESSDGDSCWAEFGMTGTNSDSSWQTCVMTVMAKLLEYLPTTEKAASIACGPWAAQVQVALSTWLG